MRHWQGIFKIIVRKQYQLVCLEEWKGEGGSRDKAVLEGCKCSSAPEKEALSKWDDPSAQTLRHGCDKLFFSCTFPCRQQLYLFLLNAKHVRWNGTTWASSGYENTIVTWIIKKKKQFQGFWHVKSNQVIRVLRWLVFHWVRTTYVRGASKPNHRAAPTGQPWPGLKWSVCYVTFF